MKTNKIQKVDGVHTSMFSGPEISYSCNIAASSRARNSSNTWKRAMQMEA